MAVGPHSPQSAVSSITPSDSVSMNGRNFNGFSVPKGDRRSKYNTLTPAEAKQMTRHLNNRQPARTASVLRKPRAPPMAVLNSTGGLSVGPALANTNGLPMTIKNRDTLNSGSCYSLHSNRGQRDANHGERISPYGSFLNGHNRHSSTNPSDAFNLSLSFRNSSSMVGSTHGANRLQTMSVDLGNPSRQFEARIDNDHELFHDCQTKEMLSDESFTSAKSHQSGAEKLKSSSKISLSSSTSKVFQNQLTTLKRFFRNMPIGRSIVGGADQKLESSYAHGDETLSDSISQLSLNRSQSPPRCPPPPGELRSMSYMENAVNYINYDEFTRVRNRQSSTLLKSQIRNDQRAQNNHENRGDQNGDIDIEPWQLTSLPVSYERNLTTVFEERQSCGDILKGQVKNTTPNGYIETETSPISNIQLPSNFEDRAYDNSGQSSDNPKTNSSSESSHSLTSVTTTDSVLDYHRQTATSFRYSYAQPNSFEIAAPKNKGLPPRIPTNDTRQGAPCNTPTTNSILTNGLHSGSINSSTVPKSDRPTDYSTANDLDKDADMTILSDTSTLHGDSGNSIYVNKCAELERTVGSLKEKLITKEKELTEMQLKQWSSDYLIDQLKSTISRLEKENAQLKALVKVNRNNL